LSRQFVRLDQDGEEMDVDGVGHSGLTASGGVSRQSPRKWEKHSRETPPDPFRLALRQTGIATIIPFFRSHDSLLRMTQPSTKPPVKKPAPKFHPYPFWSPRFWHGLRFSEWIRLCVKHRFRFHPLRWPMAFLITLTTPFNSFWSAM